MRLGALLCIGIGDEIQSTFPFILPEITSAEFTDNPAFINQAIELLVNVEETIVYLKSEEKYSAEFYGGEI